MRRSVWKSSVISVSLMALFFLAGIPARGHDVPDSLQQVTDTLALLFDADSLDMEPGADIGMEGELELRTAENLDSLINLWYVVDRGSEGSDDYDPELDTVVPTFTDSVYMARLAEIPSVVDLTYNGVVRNYIHVYTKKRREQVRNMLALSNYYFPIFEEIFDLYDLPYEIKYLSVVESALNPRAVSRVGAVGAWQFMYSTGKHYGLQINSLVDERRDPVAASHAAARFLKDLYARYGDWTLALAAYNCGPGNVNKAIRRSGGRRNFWEIYYYLPRETRGYVPAFIAATYTMNHYREHLISPASLKLPAHTDTIEIHEVLHLKQAAEVLDLPVALIRDLNPQYRADIIPLSSKKPYSLKIPASYATSFIDYQDSIFAYKDSVFFDKGKVTATPQRYSASYSVDLPADKYDKLYYKVKSGDNLGYIADWYDVRASDLRYWNNIRRNLIRVGQKLVVYKPKGKSARYKEVNDMSFDQKQAFAGRAVSSQSGQAEKSTPATYDSGSFVTYKVKSGDTLWEIARKYPGVSGDDIARLNKISSASNIKPGQVIKIKPSS